MYSSQTTFSQELKLCVNIIIAKKDKKVNIIKIK